MKRIRQKPLRTAKKCIHLHSDIHIYICAQHKTHIIFFKCNSLCICLSSLKMFKLHIWACVAHIFCKYKDAFTWTVLLPQLQRIYTTQLYAIKLGIFFLIFCTFCARPYSKQLLQSDNVSLTVFCVLHIKLNLRQTLRKRKQKAKQYSMLLFLTHKRLSVILEAMTVFSSP